MTVEQGSFKFVEQSSHYLRNSKEQSFVPVFTFIRYFVLGHATSQL